MKTVLIILAAGNSSRFDSDSPKQYTLINGDTLLNQTIKKFIQIDEIDAIKIAIGESHVDLYKSTIISHPKILPYCIGGKTRRESSYLALKSIEDISPSTVLIHDAARPYIENRVVLNILSKLPEFDAVDLGIPVTDTIKMISSEDGMEKIICLKRDDLYATQTPQGFVYRKILEAHEKAGNITVTDDVSLMMEGGYNVCCVSGDPSNLKITYKNDKRLNMRIGSGFDVHKFDEEEGEYHIMLCGISVPHNRRIIAHSDGDVALHSLTDAILGAMSAGDIGDHFPPSEEKWKGCDSSFFLKHVCSMLKNIGGSLGNVDLTIICQEPKISQYKDIMKNKLAEILGVDKSLISVKATTTENLGFTGRKEGIAVQASCLIYIPN